MKAKIITLFMILSMLFTVASFAQEIDPGTGIKISSETGFHPVWSPDGKWVVSNQQKGISLIPSEGGTEVKIYENVPYNQESKAYMAYYPCYSPDGTEILFSTYFHDKNRGTIEGYVAENTIPVILAINVETKAVRTVREEAYCPRFSHDGRYFAYVNYDHRTVTDPSNAEHNYSLAIYDTVTQETRYIAEGVGRQTGIFSFSGDDTYIAALIYGFDHTPGIYKISLDGSQIEQININQYEDHQNLFLENPTCSPDGRWIMYTAESNSKDSNLFGPALFVYNVETKETKPFFPNGSINNYYSAWSVDGKKICCDLSIDSGSYKGLYTFDFIEKNLGIEPALEEVPQYIPSVYGTEVAKIDLSTTSSTEMTSLKYNQFFPVWSPDGKWIAMTSGDVIWIVPSEGGVPIKVFQNDKSILYNGYELRFVGGTILTGFTPDSREILYQTPIIDESRGTVVTIHTNNGILEGYNILSPVFIIKAVDIFTGETRLVMDNARSGFYSHNGRYFVYNPSYPIESYGEIILYDTETKQSRKLVDNGTPFCFSHDDSYLVAAVSKTMKKIPLDGGAFEDLGPEGWFSASLSPDDRFVIYDVSESGTARLKLYDILTKSSNYLFPKDPEFLIQMASFSPDGKKFCYKLKNSWDRIYVRDIDLAKYTTVTAVEGEKPNVFALQGNYPNPFNPSTTIQFTLAASGKVNLVIYNVAGQKVRELVKDAVMTPGIHNVLWDGHNDLGIPVSSGIYLSRLQMGGKSLAGRMLLMK
jgi:Tol biopolymer transport system component